VRNGLEALAALEAPPDIVLIHDAARPIVPAEVAQALLEALRHADAAAPALAVADTVCRAGPDGAVGEDVDRAGLVRRQTPQAFRFDRILAAHRAHAGEATDDIAIAVAAGQRAVLVEGSPLLHKLTAPEDRAILESFLQPQTRMAVGQGFDVHAFGPGGAVTLCGVTIPHDQGLVGHSDADVGLHALTDAILGAVGAGDIGQHFPPSDPQWKGADSALFLERARADVEAAGGRIEHVDVTLICERPKVGPHREAMRARMAGLLGLSPAQVNVKATTTERLGFTGRGEGIAAMATATVAMPR